MRNKEQRLELERQKRDKLSRQREHINQQVRDFDKLVHTVFKLTPEGAKLLEYWKDDLMMTDEDPGTGDPMDIGRVLGRKQFVRQIIRQIEQAERNDE